MTRIYVHLHIPKNAGQTFDNILRRIFGSRLREVIEARPGQVLTLDEKRRILTEAPDTRAITGHAFRYPAPEVAGTEFRYLTFLRHPVARLVSLYAYEQEQETHQPGHSSHGPIEHWIEARLREDNALTNFQTYHLLGLQSPADFEPEAGLARAKQMVDELCLVGITERFDDSLILLARRVRLPLYALCYRRVNVTRSQDRFPISESVRRRLLELNQIDMQLFDYARGKFETELARIQPATLTAQRQQLARLNERGPRRLPWRYKLGRRLAAFVA
jgi:hypothetical protein